VIADRREYTIRRVEYVIPSGARVAEVSEVWSVAMAEYRRLRGLPDDAEVPGDWVRVTAPARREWEPRVGQQVVDRRPRWLASSKRSWMRGLCWLPRSRRTVRDG
jgi:hypothetical protein